MTTALARPRFIPTDSVELVGPDGLSVIYTYGTDKAPCAICYLGKSGRPAWNYRFRTVEQRDEQIAEQWRRIEAHQQRKAEHKAERKQPHDLKVGDCVYNSWGYDQTNIDWYQVVKATEHYVWLRAIGSQVEQDGFMSGRSAPRPGAFISEKITKHGAQMLGGEAWVTFEFGGGRRWSGASQYTSWYA